MWYASDCSGTSLIWTPLISQVSLFQGENDIYLYKVGTQSSVLINQVSLFQRCPLSGSTVVFEEVHYYHTVCVLGH